MLALAEGHMNRFLRVIGVVALVAAGLGLGYGVKVLTAPALAGCVNC